MDAVYIPQLIKLADQTCVVEVNRYLPGLDTLTPVRGEVFVTHAGTYVEIHAHADAIVTLTCDRCLEHYNYRIQVSPHELIWLQNSPIENGSLPLEREVLVEDLVETLPPEGYFYPFTWLYEQLCLALPSQKICRVDCGGIQVDASSTSQDTGLLDSRWSALTQLKRQIDQSNS